MAAISLVARDAAILVARDGNALTNFFSLPVILGAIALIVFLIGLACLIKIGTQKDKTNGATMPM